jgi:methionyl-tRNA formyltransferase
VGDSDPVRTLFFGSGQVALPALRELLANPGVALDSVVTAPPRAAGRKGHLAPTLVANAAAAAGLRVRAPSTLRDATTLAELADAKADLIVLADYGRIIPAAVLDLPRHGALNIHPSLLPRYRGAAPVPATILSGDPVAGVTLMQMDEGMDTGPTLAQRELPLDGTEIAPDLESRLAEMGAALLMEHLPAWLDGTLVATPQPDLGVSTTRLLRRSDGLLDPSRPAAYLARQVRAYQPWPGCHIEHDGERLKVWAASVLDAPASIAPGDLAPAAGTMCLGTVDGALCLDEVQPAGRRRMSGPEYRRGKHL